MDQFAFGRVRVDPDDWPMEFRLKATRRVSLALASDRRGRRRLRGFRRDGRGCFNTPGMRPEAGGESQSVRSPTTTWDALGEFLHAHLNRRVPPSTGRDPFDVPWSVDSPNHGFMLLDDNAIVGAYLAFYSERRIDGRAEPFCNLGAWCVLPSYRFHSLRLLNALLAQPRYHFTDLSPSGNTVPVNLRLEVPVPRYDDRAHSQPPLAVVAGPERDQRRPGAHRAHADRARPRGLSRSRARPERPIISCCNSGDESCYVVFRRDRRKSLPFFASILYVSNPDLFRTMVRPFVRHLLLRHGVLATLAELRIVSHRPWLSILLRSPRPKMFKSPISSRCRSTISTANSCALAGRTHQSTQHVASAGQRVGRASAAASLSGDLRQPGFSMRTQLHHIVAETARTRGDSPALTFKDHSVDLRRALATRSSASRPACAASASSAASGSPSTSTSASRPWRRSSARRRPAACSCRSIPLLRPKQVAYILNNCNVRVLVTSAERFELLRDGARASARRCDTSCCWARRRASVGRRPPTASSPGTTWLSKRRPTRRRSTASSTSTWRRSSTPRAAPASPRAWCSRIAT